MASRLNFSTGAIVNPLEGLQQAVTSVGGVFDKYVQREQDREDRLAREAEDRRRYETQLGRYDRQEQESLRRYEEGKELSKLEREEARKWKEKEFGLRETEAQQQKALRDMQIAEAKEVAASKKALREFDSSKIGSIIQDPAVSTLRAREDQLWSSGLEQNKDGTYSQNVVHLADPTTTVDRLKGAVSSASAVDKKDATRRLTQYLVGSGVDRATAGTIAAQEVDLQDNVADFKALDEAARKQRQEEFKDRLAVTKELGDLITSRGGTNVTVNSDGSKTGLDLLPKTIEHVGKAFEGDDQTYVVKGLTDASLRLSDKFTPKELVTGMAMYGNTLHTSGLISGGYGKMKGYEGDVSTGFEQFMAENSDKLKRTATEDSNGLRNTYLQSLQNLNESLVSRIPSTENQRLAAMRAGMDMPTLQNNEGLMSDSMFGSDQNRLLRNQDAGMYGTAPTSRTATTVTELPAANVSTKQEPGDSIDLLSRQAINAGVSPTWVRFKTEEARKTGDLSELQLAAESGTSSATVRNLYGLNDLIETGGKGLVNLGNYAWDIPRDMLLGATYQQAESEASKRLAAAQEKDKAQTNRALDYLRNRLPVIDIRATR